jgi:hypothetical protein
MYFSVAKSSVLARFVVGGVFCGRVSWLAAVEVIVEEVVVVIWGNIESLPIPVRNECSWRQ